VSLSHVQLSLQHAILERKVEHNTQRLLLVWQPVASHPNMMAANVEERLGSEGGGNVCCGKCEEKQQHFATSFVERTKKTTLNWLVRMRVGVCSA
jgi:hypothetical protein